MPDIVFDPTLFRTQYPEFSANPPNTDALLQAYFDSASQYISADTSDACWVPDCSALTAAQQTLALNLMTAHLAKLGALIATGQVPGFVTNSTIDDVTVAVQAPPATDQWQWWLNQTGYGAQLLALLDVQSVGGFYFGGSAPRAFFRDGNGGRW